MADEELHETTADDQKDLQSADDTAAVEEITEDVATRLPLTKTSPTMTISIFLWTVSKRC